MALNTLYKWTQTRELTVPSGTVSGQPVAVGGVVGVALTSRGDATKTVGETTFPSGGIGNRTDGATVALDGTFILPVTGVTGSTLQGVPVYILSNGTLSTSSATGAKPFGAVDGYPGKQTAAACAVKVGPIVVAAS